MAEKISKIGLVVPFYSTNKDLLVILIKRLEL